MVIGIREVAKRSWTGLNCILTSLDSGGSFTDYLRELPLLDLLVEQETYLKEQRIRLLMCCSLVAPSIL